LQEQLETTSGSLSLEKILTEVMEYKFSMT
jgi:hypothetical protein